MSAIGDSLRTIAMLSSIKADERKADNQLVSQMMLNKRNNDLKLHLVQLGQQNKINSFKYTKMYNETEANDKIITELEDELTSLGVTISEQNNLNSDDKTSDAESILNFSYQETENNKKEVENKQEFMVNELNLLSKEIVNQENKIIQLKNTKRQFAEIDKAFKGHANKLFDIEESQKDGDFILDKKELDAYFDVNKDELDAYAETFGGGEAGMNEAKLRITAKFADVSKDRLARLVKVTSIMKNRVQADYNRKKIEELGPTGEKAAKKLYGIYDDKVKEVSGSLKGLNFTKDVLEQVPVLHNIQIDKPDKSELGFVLYGKALDRGFAGLVNDVLDEGNHDKFPAKFQNDFRLASLWYSGRINQIDDESKDRADVYYKDKEGNEYELITDNSIINKFSEKRLKGLDLDLPSGILGGVDKEEGFYHDTFINGVRDFLNAYSDYYDYKDTLSINAKNLSEAFPSLSINEEMYKSSNNKMISDVSTNKDNQASLDELNRLDIFLKDNNIDEASLEGFAKNNNMSISEYMDFIDDKNKFNIANLNSKDINQAKEEYYEGGADSRGVEIIERINQIEKEKNSAFNEYMNQFGNVVNQKIAKTRIQKGEMGLPWETLHEEGADLIDELKYIEKLALKGKIDDTIVNTFTEFIGGTGSNYTHRDYSKSLERSDNVDLVRALDSLSSEELASGYTSLNDSIQANRDTLNRLRNLDSQGFNVDKNEMKLLSEEIKTSIAQRNTITGASGTVARRENIERNVGKIDELAKQILKDNNLPETKENLKIARERASNVIRPVPALQYEQSPTSLGHQRPAYDSYGRIQR